ncbi:NADH:ubiquinone reductase (Na(+)-transporting) subunit C [Penaeicola halotolerans]|uniref:NADH:ubiquinone reductase (Na(+)-transporting) subunit C n=1 Tax=Penaeicola halotolerans TaxID=2793196 RepID=UPI001CF8EC7D|nr:NADH:ubiquinone reductase (Na(+)-transporting) subunit C [Penaeicola halotolerans]
MRQSNVYVITFSIILTVVLGLLLSGTSQILGPKQKVAIELDTKKQILGAVMDIEGEQDILGLYQKRISSFVVDANGEIVEKNEKGETLIAENVDVAKNYKKAPEDRLYPVFKFHAEGNEDDVESYILPLYGAGLWDAIWGYLALDTDFNTIKGVVFAHAGETPGLGARITEDGVQARYDGKQIFDENGELVAVEMMKGEGKDYSDDPHKVDGMSGATITANGVNAMLKNYISHYQPYISKAKSGGDAVAIK